MFWADRVLAHETNALNYAVIVAIQCGLAVVLLKLAASARLNGVPTRVWAAGICLALLFWAGQYQNFVWGFQVQFVGVTLAAAGTFATLALVRQPAVGLAGTIVIESIGVYTLASGVLIPILATVLAIILRRPKQHVALLAAAALLLLSGYLWGYHTPPESSDPLSAWRNAGSIVLYLCAVIGAPIGNFALLQLPPVAGVCVSAIAGALGCYAIGRLAVKVLGPGETMLPAQAALLVTSGFVIGMVGITAIGRIRFGITSAFASRYTSPAVVFWYCLAIFAASRASLSNRVPTVILLGALVLPVLMALTESENASIAQEWIMPRRAATPAILAGVDDTDLLIKVYAIPANGQVADSQLARFGPLMRSAGTSIFADPWARWLGTKLTSHVAGVDPALCMGTLEQTRRVATQNAPGYRAIGHAWRIGSGEPIDKLVITDASGDIVGYGMGRISFAAAGIENPASNSRADTAWVGDFSHATPGAVTAYALVGRYACGLAGHG